ncbi:NAD-P-binding protein [Sistotremastrum niveocremeum HHB9708]|uniref:NAD-P-binding protein n=1 Tax=Sistotremastrum niveocremeum HHB9708 TaxID=1314777 RepID=A0A165AFC2_9AGAM|nr:NAD-P-binding protein [Sistotremastrum niveocremeum HHB9708]
MPAPAEDLTTTERNDIYPGIDPTSHYKDQTYKGKVVFITGANRGIGEATALFYARAGATVSLAARDASLLEAVKAQILKENPSAQVATFATDVKSVEQVQAAIEGTVAKFGKLDVVFANAGVADRWIEPFTATDPNTWWSSMEINLRGVYNVAHFALPHLDKTNGYFVATSSKLGVYRQPFTSSYAVAKHALIRLIEFIAIEHPQVKAYAIHPGLIKTGATDANPGMWDCPDTPELPAGTLLRLTSGKEDWLAGGYVSSNWDFDEVTEKYKEKIIELGGVVSRLTVPQ